MKIKILISLIVLSFTLISQPVLAESATSTAAATRKQTREEIQTRKQEARATLSEAKQRLVQTFFNSIKNDLTKKHDAFLKIKDKIQARIDQNPMNKDTTAAKAELAKFSAAESRYQADLTLLETKFTELQSSAKPSEVVKSLKDITRLIREDLSAIKKVLNATIIALAQAPKLEVTKTK